MFQFKSRRPHQKESLEKTRFSGLFFIVRCRFAPSDTLPGAMSVSALITQNLLGELCKPQEQLVAQSPGRAQVQLAGEQQERDGILVDCLSDRQKVVPELPRHE